MTALESVCWPLVAVAVVAAAVVDWRRRSMPKTLSVALILACLAVRGVLEGVGSAGTGLVSGLLGAVGCAGPFALLALSGPRVGWGDVLMLAGVGAGLGFPRALAAAFLVSLIGAAAALAVLWRRKGPGPGSAGPVHGNVDSARAIPYGVPIALGAVWAMVWAGPAVAPEVDEMLEPTFEQLDAGAVEPFGPRGAP